VAASRGNEYVGFITTTMRGPIVKHEEAVESMAVERYVLGELHDIEREQFEEHFFSCPECAQEVRDLSTVAAGAKELLGQPREVEPPKRRAAAPATAWLWPWLRLSPNFAWGGALVLVALFSGYQTQRIRVAMRPQTLPAVLLLPETKGEEVSIPVQRIGAFLLLEADLPGSTGDVQWDLRQTSSGKVIGREAAPAPVHGASFKVLLPSSTLAPGDYTLTVHSSTVPSGRSWVFKFKIDPSGR